MPQYVALLRGVNVGRAKRVAMADLRALFTDLGYDGVRTVLQSGNVAFRTASPLAADAATQVETALRQRTGVSCWLPMSSSPRLPRRVVSSATRISSATRNGPSSIAVTTRTWSDPGHGRVRRAPGERCVHAPVATRLQRAGVSPVLDLGGGNGTLAAHLAIAGVPTVVVDRAAYVERAPRPAIRADARRLPFVDNSFGAVAALWMLYHLAEPRIALVEASRVLRPRGLFVACTSSRRNDSEFAAVLPGWGDAFVFDAESAVEVVADVFDVTDVQRWDAPMVTLPDRAAVQLFLRGRGLSPARARQAADDFSVPMMVTKRGVLVWATSRCSRSAE